MTPILDQHGMTVAYLHLNIILNTEQDRVLGLVLGNCVFGAADSPVGKFFKDTFRNMRGEIVAELASTTSPLRPSNEPLILQQAWQKLTGVKNHLCTWIEEKKHWSGDEFASFLHYHESAAVAV